MNMSWVIYFKVLITVKGSRQLKLLRLKFRNIMNVYKNFSSKHFV